MKLLELGDLVHEFDDVSDKDKRHLFAEKHLETLDKATADYYTRHEVSIRRLLGEIREWALRGT